MMYLIGVAMNKFYVRLVIAIFFASVLSACGGGGGNGGGNQPPPQADTDLDWDQGNWDEENWQ